MFRCGFFGIRGFIICSFFWYRGFEVRVEKFKLVLIWVYGEGLFFFLFIVRKDFGGVEGFVILFVVVFSCFLCC